MATSSQKDFRKWQADGHSFQHRGHSIFYQRDGSHAQGPAVLCIHGFPTASWDWHKLWPQLAERSACLLAPDMVGFGWSDKPKAYRYSMADQADLHEALLREQRVTRFRILAHDYGDTVAQELLARHEERKAAGDRSLVIERICLLNGGLFPESHRARPVQKLLRTPLGPLISRLVGRRAFGKSFSAVFGAATQPTEAELDEFWTLLEYKGGHRISHRLLHYIGERRQYRDRWVGALIGTQVPVRLINGPDDPVSGRHMTERYRELVDHPDIVLLPGIGHYPQVEDAEGVWAGLQDFLFV